MVKYINSKIYEIISDDTDQKYIGVTVHKYLKTHLGNQRHIYHKWLENPGKYKYRPVFALLKYI